MKVALTSLLFLLTTWSFGQTIPIPAMSSASFKETGNVINEGAATDNGAVHHAFIIVYNGDISALIKRLGQDLGKGVLLFENAANRHIAFRRIVKPEWTEKKANLELKAVSNDDRHLITITCTGAKKADYLTPGSDSQKKIKAYLKTIIEG
jgi:hypothetical protein